MNGFDGIAENYNELWFFSGDYQGWMLKNILNYLSLEENDLFADIGGGTGSITEKIRSVSGLVRDPYCVEPSKEMLAKAKIYSHINCVNQTGEEFVARHTGLDKLLIKETIHHISNRAKFWTQLYTGSPDSTTLVVTRPQKPGFPLFEKAYLSFEKQQPAIEVLESEIEGSGFSHKTFRKSWQVNLSKENWFRMLRARFISNLFECSDEEIESGILELDCKFGDGPISFSDDIIFILVSRY